MTKGFNKLTKKEKQELEKLIKEITEEAKKVVEDYANNPSELSGSVIEVHEGSPYLAEKEERLIKLDGKKFNIKINKKP